MINDIGAQIVPHLIGVPGRTTQQVLDPMGRRLARLLGELPAVLALHGA